MNHTFSFWIKHLQDIYGDRNRRPDGNRELYFCNNLNITAIQLHKFARRGGQSEVVKGRLAMVVAWFLGHRPLDAENLGSLLFRHYPNMCPYCRKSVCKCKGWKGKLVRFRAQAPSGIKDLPLRDLQGMFRSIYPSTTVIDSSWKIVEECGEWTDTITRKVLGHGDLRRQGEETADVCAHFFGLANALGISLDYLLWRVFKDGCPVCRRKICTGCPSFAHIKADSVIIAAPS